MRELASSIGGRAGVRAMVGGWVRGWVGGRAAGQPVAPSLRFWWLAALGLIVARAMITKAGGFAADLGDSDDATRLVQVREFIAGAGWFDPVTTTLGGHDGMRSHWSRLIDLPLAVMIGALGLVMSQGLAETVVRAVWPLMVLAPVLWAVAANVERVADRTAAVIALALVALCPLGLYQFDPGRIDHHNLMIAAIVAAVLLVWAPPRGAPQGAADAATPQAGMAAGALTGLSLAIGYEALAPAAALTAIVAVWGLIDRAATATARAFIIAVMVTLTLGFVTAVAPSRWFDVRCDALSANLVLLALAGGTGLVVALGRGRDWPLAGRLAGIAVCGGVGLAAFGLMEPSCLGGPMGQLPANLGPIWLDHVDETRSILRDMAIGRIEEPLGMLLYLCAGLSMAGLNAWSSRCARDWVLLAISIVFAGLACWQFKFVGYASLLLVAPMAVAFSRLPSWRGLLPATVRIVATVLMSQACLMTATKLAQRTLDRQAAVDEAAEAGSRSCLTAGALADLAGLPPGLIAGHINLGAFVPAFTQHRALSAPYHRIADAIITNHMIFSARDETAAGRLIAREGIDYVVTCSAFDGGQARSPEWAGTLRAGLEMRHAPAFLIPVALRASAPLRVWRVDRSRLPPA